MKRRPARKSSWLSLLLVIAAVALWALDQKRAAAPSKNADPTRVENHAPPHTPPKTGPAERTGAYEIHESCTLVQARNNDGDSFMLRLPDGRQAEFRLYFVDTPESAFKTYAGGQSNHERIRQQAADLGGITPTQAVEIGKKGKTFTLALLGSAPFTVFTCWDSPFQDNRYHAFIRVKDGGRERWLHELLVERGLARIKTKPADLPDGTPADRQRDKLRQLERSARKNGTGVWAL